MKKYGVEKSEAEGEFNLPEREEEILALWKSKHVFEKSVEKRKTNDRKKTFVFYEGPPYANGRPGIHHVLARVVKDIILRYKSMAGFYVPRRAGWDTHGLPVEIAAEKALGLKSKKDIERVGIKAFNEKAKENVWLYKNEWEQLTERIGYWLDLKNAYVTYAPEYIESIWWTLRRIADRKLLYKGHKVVPWCARCGTALSSHELAQGYKETTDTSAYVRFKIKNQKSPPKADPPLAEKIKNIQGENLYVLSWTTTPWTLPGNVALAVGEKIKYQAVRAHGSDDVFILARERVGAVFNNPAEKIDVIKTFSGGELVGLEYEPLFSVPSLKNKKAYKIYPADFVTTTDGTGVVHVAAMYGEDDYELGKKVGLPQRHTVDEEGKFTNEVPEGLAGLSIVEGERKNPDTEKKILDYLHSTFRILRTESFTHEYPHCWRCGTPVLYYARNSWFIGMSALRRKLSAQNKKINWIPSHMKDGRFGEWLREAKDWNLSRERFWGAPLPIWECGTCAATEVIGGLDELSARAGGSKNRYWVMRHGEAESNVKDIIDAGQGKKNFHLTPRGKAQIHQSAKKLAWELGRAKQKIDLIAASDITRTKETAHFVAEALGIKKLFFDERIREIRLGSLSGCHDKKYRELFPTYEARFAVRPEGGGESLRDVRARIAEFFKDCEKKYDGKNILIVSHEYPIWMMCHVALGWSEARAIREKEARGNNFMELAEAERLPYKVIPRSDTGEVDLHRPYADEIVFSCRACGSLMRRVKEVADVWYDSGAMPFAQGLRPWAKGHGSWVMGQELPEAYPADFISEGMDQTRGWFYTLLAVATALGYKAPYKNVISLGLINDKHGQKMSKSRGNIVDPWEVIKKYGADAVRWYFYVSSPAGEPKNFDEQEIAKTFRRFHLIIWNSIKFWETYRAVSGVRHQVSRVKGQGSGKKNFLDVWVLARFKETVAEVTKKLEGYDIREAALAIESFVDDLSRWYIRRSRRRFQKPASAADHRVASATLGYVLRELGKLIAPFTPFFAEIIHKELGGADSIHFENWPKTNLKLKTENLKLIEQMAEMRRLAALGLAARAQEGIKVRQPLGEMRVSAKGGSASGGKGQASSINEELLGILAEEINVKKVVFVPNLKNEVELDTTITAELRAEGVVRECVRMIQGLRLEAKLEPKNRIALFLELPVDVKSALMKHQKTFMAEVGAARVEYKKSSKFDAEIYSKIGNANAWIALKKR